jgi:hypothetical protein
MGRKLPNTKPIPSITASSQPEYTKQLSALERVIERVFLFLENGWTLTAMGIAGSLLGLFLDGRYFVALCILLLLGMHRSGALKGLNWKMSLAIYVIVFVVFGLILWEIGVATNISRKTLVNDIVTKFTEEVGPNNNQNTSPIVEVSHEFSMLPIIIPANAKALILVTHENRTANFIDLSNPKSAPYEWSPWPKDKSEPSLIYKYRFVNQSKDRLYNLRTKIVINYGLEKDAQHSETSLDLDIPWLMPGEPMEFYTVNDSPFTVSVTIPASVKVQVEGESVTRAVTLKALVRNPMDEVPPVMIPRPSSLRRQ